MNRFIFSAIAMLMMATSAWAQTKTSPLYVDANGVMRRTATGKEVSYCGVNYTLPFAHSYRAADMLGVDRLKAIDHDVYHFARLGFNAFRIHIWDVEISDAKGNLLNNDHLRTLDYLIQKLEERGIDIILTAQTNFGNGYPERNIKTDGYTYNYDKCQVHSDPEAVKAQQNYIKQLALHTNAFTGKSYADDPGIVAFEINNEPCHAVSKEDTKSYINKMVDALKSTGYNKTILYNVSHNHDFVEAYFDANIDGGTYQWYPTGLVSGHRQPFNFLPYVDNYNIDFKDVDGFDSRTKVIYEYDPADILDTYLFPAVMRSFRSAGFQWATQFAYDATFLACYNTDYQTHYLNLAYTPGKAVGLKIAGEVAKEVPMYAKFPKYPNDTVFLSTTVSYNRNLAIFNNGEKYFYTNNCNVAPINIKKLKEICGVGSSPVVKYSGTGAYFVDQIAKGVWRLEVMPDHVIVNDPFAKPSLSKKVAVITGNSNTISLNIPDLGAGFGVEGISDGAKFARLGDTLSITPGVYILSSTKAKTTPDRNFTYNNIRVSEYYAPQPNVDKVYLTHQSDPYVEIGNTIDLKATIVAPQRIDSVVVLPATASFWNDHNPNIRMKSVDKYNYKCTIPTKWLMGNSFSYYIIVYSDGKPVTFPSGIEGTPLDWDSDRYETYTTEVVKAEAPAVLIASAADDPDVIVKILPTWGRSRMQKQYNMPFALNALQISSASSNTPRHAIIYKDIKSIVQSRKNCIVESLYIKIQPSDKDMKLTVGFVDTDGFTFASDVEVPAGEDRIRIPLMNFSLAPTYFLRETYPTFCHQMFEPEGKRYFDPNKIALLEIMTEHTTEPFELGLVGAWLR
ncbi:MAG: glycoside hydrolase family 5 protein [Bacteroidales bacterium]|nr:glycoside hydrolase family 5 protein [Bacteroidales bacterium]